LICHVSPEVAVKKSSLLVLCLVAAGVLAACSSPNADWQKATSQGTVAAYQKFIQEHPSDPRVQRARARISALNDEKAWNGAKSADTLAAYQDYLQQFPNGMHAAQAQDKVTSMQESADWQSAQSAGTADALQSFLQKYPNAPQAAQARAQLDKLTGYQAELAAFRSKPLAERIAKERQAKFGSELQGITVVSSHGLNHVVSAPMTEADAKAACQKLQKARMHCVVIKRLAGAAQ
jgi:outer membrane protein assembly factor BamD (BamD/ComL family)